MPVCRIVFFKDCDDGKVASHRQGAPVLVFLDDLRDTDMKAFEKCIAAIERLAQLGHELRRPETDYLRDGIHELRVRRGHVNYRILYSFIDSRRAPGGHAAVLLHGFTKEAEVPAVELARATRRLFCFHSAPHVHTYSE